MSTGRAPADGLTRDARAGLFVLGLVIVALVLVVVGVRYWTDDSPRAELARSAVVSPSPEPLSPGETYVLTEALPSGDLVVTQWISAEQPLDSVLLSPPGLEGTKRVLADQVRVVADDEVVEGAELISGQPRRYSFPDASNLQITYRLVGAVERSGSAPGRALARLTALDVSYDPASVHVTRSVIAPGVLSLACASPEVPTVWTPCGVRATDGEWTVELEGPNVSYRVMAQLTLG